MWDGQWALECFQNYSWKKMKKGLEFKIGNFYIKNEGLYNIKKNIYIYIIIIRNKNWKWHWVIIWSICLSIGTAAGFPV